jgi:hypothetical protein
MQNIIPSHLKLVEGEVEIAFQKCYIMQYIIPSHLELENKNTIPKISW